jgi:hypothetical protein
VLLDLVRGRLTCRVAGQSLLASRNSFDHRFVTSGNLPRRRGTHFRQKSLNRVGDRLGVANRVLDVAVPWIGLQCPVSCPLLAEGLAAEIMAAGGRAIAAMADVAESATVEMMVARAEKELGPVTILVNNAGVSRRRGSANG